MREKRACTHVEEKENKLKTCMQVVYVVSDHTQIETPNMHASGYIWYHGQKKENKLQTCMQVGMCCVRLCMEREKRRSTKA